MTTNRKSLSLILFLCLTVFSNIFAQTQTAPAEPSTDLSQIMETMVVVTLVFAAVIMWLIIVYSEKNDNSGSMFLSPLIKFKNYMISAAPIEKESEMLLDHDYDGIKELDNKIPPWFSVLFYGTILFGIIYMLNFHVFGDGHVGADEYRAEMRQADLEHEILVKSGALLDENTITRLTDVGSISEGKEIFNKNCVSCHGQHGEGLVGPNLTDVYWIHGGGIKNIFKTISNGVLQKGMPIWKNQLAPKQIQEVASFVMSLEGTNPPNPKAPQGNKYTEPADSTAKKGS